MNKDAEQHNPFLAFLKSKNKPAVDSNTPAMKVEQSQDQASMGDERASVTATSRYHSQKKTFLSLLRNRYPHQNNLARSPDVGIDCVALTIKEATTQPAALCLPIDELNVPMLRRSSEQEVVLTPTEKQRLADNLITEYDMAALSKQGVSPLVLKCLANVESFSTAQSIECIRECVAAGNTNIGQTQVDDEVVFVLGPSGAGKSTAINFLNGCQMQAVDGRIVVAQSSQYQAIADIGHGDNSCTFLPTIMHSTSTGITFCDCPGFLDNRGQEINIANTINIRNVAQRARSVKALLVISYPDIMADRAHALQALEKDVEQLLGGAQSLCDNLSSIVIAVTKVPKTVNGVVPNDLMIRDLLQEGCSLPDAMLNNAMILDPIPNTRVSANLRTSWLDKLSKMPCFKQVQTLFASTLNDSDFLFIETLVKSIHASIEQCCTGNDFVGLHQLIALQSALRIIDHPQVNAHYDATIKQVAQSWSTKMQAYKKYCYASDLETVRQFAKQLLTMLLTLSDVLGDVDQRFDEVAQCFEKAIVRIQNVELSHCLNDTMSCYLDAKNPQEIAHTLFKNNHYRLFNWPKDSLDFLKVLTKTSPFLKKTPHLLDSYTCLIRFGNQLNDLNCIKLEQLFFQLQGDVEHVCHRTLTEIEQRIVEQLSQLVLIETVDPKVFEHIDGLQSQLPQSDLLTILSSLAQHPPHCTIMSNLLVEYKQLALYQSIDQQVDVENRVLLSIQNAVREHLEYHQQCQIQQEMFMDKMHEKKQQLRAGRVLNKERLIEIHRENQALQSMVKRLEAQRDRQAEYEVSIQKKNADRQAKRIHTDQTLRDQYDRRKQQAGSVKNTYQHLNQKLDANLRERAQIRKREVEQLKRERARMIALQKKRAEKIEQAMFKRDQLYERQQQLMARKRFIEAQRKASREAQFKRRQAAQIRRNEHVKKVSIVRNAANTRRGFHQAISRHKQLIAQGRAAFRANPQFAPTSYNWCRAHQNMVRFEKELLEILLELGASNAAIEAQKDRIKSAYRIFHSFHKMQEMAEMAGKRQYDSATMRRKQQESAEAEQQMEADLQDEGPNFNDIDLSDPFDNEGSFSVVNSTQFEASIENDFAQNHSDIVDVGTDLADLESEINALSAPEDLYDDAQEIMGEQLCQIDDDSMNDGVMAGMGEGDFEWGQDLIDEVNFSDDGQPDVTETVEIDYPNDEGVLDKDYFVEDVGDEGEMLLSDDDSIRDNFANEAMPVDELGDNTAIDQSFGDELDYNAPLDSSFGHDVDDHEPLDQSFGDELDDNAPLDSSFGYDVDDHEPLDQSVGDSVDDNPSIDLMGGDKTRDDPLSDEPRFEDQMSEEDLASEQVMDNHAIDDISKQGAVSESYAEDDNVQSIPTIGGDPIDDTQSIDVLKDIAVTHNDIQIEPVSDIAQVEDDTQVQFLKGNNQLDSEMEASSLDSDEPVERYDEPVNNSPLNNGGYQPDTAQVDEQPYSSSVPQTIDDETQNDGESDPTTLAESLANCVGSYQRAEQRMQAQEPRDELDDFISASAAQVDALEDGGSHSQHQSAPELMQQSIQQFRGGDVSGAIEKAGDTLEKMGSNLSGWGDVLADTLSAGGEHVQASLGDAFGNSDDQSLEDMLGDDSNNRGRGSSFFNDVFSSQSHDGDSDFAGGVMGDTLNKVVETLPTPFQKAKDVYDDLTTIYQTNDVIEDVYDDVERGGAFNADEDVYQAAQDGLESTLAGSEKQQHDNLRDKAPGALGNLMK